MSSQYGPYTGNVRLAPVGIHVASPSNQLYAPFDPHICTPILPHTIIHPNDVPPKANRVIPSPLQPHISMADRFLHWMMPYGLNKLHSLSSLLPPHIIAHEHVMLVWAVKPKTLSNYGVCLVHFTQFCDSFNIPEPLRMPSPEWLLAHFITTHGAGSVGGGSLRTWLLGLELWHIVNGMPWHGTAHMKRAIQGSKSNAPPGASLSKWAPITLAHLHTLHSSLDLNNTFDAAIFTMATVGFWCHCGLAEVCIDHCFNPMLHAHHSTPQKSGKFYLSHILGSPNKNKTSRGIYNVD